jgi:hypothetical protein
MSENWTKGPWWFEADTDEDNEGAFYVCHEGTSCPETTICAFEGYEEHDEANAHLIAAAPEMYALLNSIKDELLYKLSFDETSGIGSIAEGFGQAINDLLKKARGEA